MFSEFSAYRYLRFGDHAPIKKLSKKKSLIDEPWIDNYLRHLMRVRDACFIKYCRAKKATQKLEIHVEYKVLRDEIKMNTKQAKKILPGFIRKK